jgi:hypothetical protein
MPNMQSLHRLQPDRHWLILACLSLYLHMQDKCSLIQVQSSFARGGASISLKKCVGHKGMLKLMTTPSLSIKASKCTNCIGCKECKQPVPLILPESIGGSGCTAEVAAKAEDLRQLASNKASASRSSAAGTHHQAGSAGAQGDASRTAGAGNAAAEASPSSNPALVECAVCHRKPGDPGVPATLKLCGGCRRMRYCSAECQRKDWKLGHRHLCEQMHSGGKPS